MIPLCVLALALATLHSGTASNARLVAEADPASVAWRAYNAAERGDRAEVPALEAALASLQNDTGTEQQFTTLAVLDALLRLDAKPPLDVIASIFDRYPVQAVLMLKRFGAERDSTALALLRRSKGHRWFALASLLQATKASGFARYLLADLPIQLSVSVSDDGRGNLGAGSGGSASCGDGGIGLAGGFPPLARYRFASPRETRATLLVDGVQPTYYVRDLSPAGETPFASSCEISGPTTRDRLAQLSAMLGGGSAPLREVELEFVAWSDPADTARRVTAARRRVEESYSALVERLKVEGWLTATEVSDLYPDIHVEMHDLRTDKRDRLPVP